MTDMLDTCGLEVIELSIQVFTRFELSLLLHVLVVPTWEVFPLHPQPRRGAPTFWTCPTGRSATRCPKGRIGPAAGRACAGR